jgi:RecA/RadA recombinase
MQMGSSGRSSDIDVVPTGSIGLNLALGVGGYARGRIVEIYGAEMCGKTTLALHAAAEAQRLGGSCTFIDAEHAVGARCGRSDAAAGPGVREEAWRQRRRALHFSARLSLSKGGRGGNQRRRGSKRSKLRTRSCGRRRWTSSSSTASPHSSPRPNWSQNPIAH